jgi:hypothetical protein
VIAANRAVFSSRPVEESDAARCWDLVTTVSRDLRRTTSRRQRARALVLPPPPEITARQNHSFYISHYPIGRDAAVSWGGPDFVFVNDMQHALLIKASYTSDTLTFSFYGTDPGRRVEISTGERVNWRSPQVSYALEHARAAFRLGGQHVLRRQPVITRHMRTIAPHDARQGRLQPPHAPGTADDPAHLAVRRRAA